MNIKFYVEYLQFYTGFSRQPFFTSGEIATNIPERARRQHVVKYGSESGFTLGTLQLFQAHARYDNISLVIEDGYEPHDMTTVNRFRMFGQLEVYSTCNEPFAVVGDSGSLVFMLKDNYEDDLVCVGMVVGTSTHGSCIITPIADVLRAFNLPLCLSRFAHSPQIRVPTGASSDPPPSLDNTLRLILSEISELKQSTQQSIDNLKHYTKQSIDDLEMRFISREQRLYERVENHDIHAVDIAQSNSNEPNGRGEDSDESL